MNLNNIRSPLEIEPFFRANTDRLTDPQWLTQAIAPQCRWVKRQGGGILSAQQNPQELAQWLILAASFKPTSYLEFGVFQCGTFYLTDSYLRATVPNYGRALAVDKDDAPATFDDYTKGKDVRFIRSRTFLLPKFEEGFDCVLIDAGHGKQRVLYDFEIVKDSARLVGFHDTAWLRTSATTGAAWREIKAAHPERKTWDIAADGTNGIAFGIGAILMR